MLVNICILHFFFISGFNNHSMGEDIQLKWVNPPLKVLKMRLSVLGIYSVFKALTTYSIYKVLTTCKSLLGICPSSMF